MEDNQLFLNAPGCGCPEEVAVLGERETVKKEDNSRLSLRSLLGSLRMTVSHCASPLSSGACGRLESQSEPGKPSEL